MFRRILFILLIKLCFVYALPWHEYIHSLPKEARAVGYNRLHGKSLYACQTNLWGSHQLGVTQKAPLGRCYLPYANKVYTVDKFSVLGDVLGVWQPYYGYYPKNAIVLGYGVKNVPLALCRGFYRHSLWPGKTWRGHKSCDVVVGRRVKHLWRYSILVHPRSKPGRG